MKKLTIVVGAGASKEFGLPTGAELKDVIAALATIKLDDWGEPRSGDINVLNSIHNLQRRTKTPRGQYYKAAEAIRRNMPIAPSIDNFIDTHQDNGELVQVAKICMAKAIMEAERNSSLFCSATERRLSTFDLSKVSSTWLGRFFTILVAQRDFRSFLEVLANITFISFNYDRCIYHFFRIAAQSYFGLSNDEAVEVLNAMNVIYPYGSLGHYHIETYISDEVFGKDISRIDLEEVSSGLKTFTESVASDTVVQIREAFNNADVALFMGFGFLRLNVELLFGGQKFPLQKAIGSIYGLSGPDEEMVEAQLLEVFSEQRTKPVDPLSSGFVKLEKLTCGNLVKEYHMYLSSLG